MSAIVTPGDTITPSIAARRQRWRAFLQPDAAPGFCFFIRCNDPKHPLPPTPPLWPDKAKERIEYNWRVYQRALY